NYHTLFDSNKDGVIYTDLNGKILDANKAYLDLFGYTLEEIKEFTYQQLTPKKWHKLEEDIVKNQIKARGYPDEYEKEYIKKDGTIFPISIRVWLNKDKQDKPLGMWGIARDISVRKQMENALRQSEQKYRTLADNVNDGIYIISIRSGFVYVNPTFEQITGYKSEELLRESFYFYTIIHPDDVESIKKRRDARIKGNKAPSVYEFRIVNKKGEIRFVEVNSVGIPDSPDKILGILRDITERKQMEEKLRENQK
ncbi:unnamed protein product, partial [marine sediment metagenome]